MPKTSRGGSRPAAKPRAKSNQKTKSRTKPGSKPQTVAKNTASKLKRKLFPKRTVLKRAASGKRLLQQPQRLWYNPLTWRHRPPVPKYKPLPKARLLFWHALKQLWTSKWLFLGIIAVYGVLDLVLVRGLSGGASNLSQVKASLDGVLHGVMGKLFTSFVSLSYLVASSGASTSATAAIYEGILLVLCSLAYIWALRQTLSGHKVRVRDSFYQGMYPLVTFLLIFLLLSIQLLPLAAAGGLFTLNQIGGFAVHWYEWVIYIAVILALAFWSLRMITATLFAFYIVTLPGMTPMRAYRNARQLVYGRRLLLWRKLIFLPIIVVVLTLLVEVPMILWVTPLASWTFFIITMVALPIVHGYLYNLYREML